MSPHLYSIPVSNLPALYGVTAEVGQLLLPEHSAVRTEVALGLAPKHARVETLQEPRLKVESSKLFESQTNNFSYKVPAVGCHSC